ncbi:hypothetical protein DRE_01802 [Drechslerella stenobrocha 248]|uniref:Uncharacterized protein n=1 Tax=Drechslerella stenobrocha 248 TaxID=1043628 RepID=W7IH64_9PEZI|nr:hypothetical protein DRE_01802 [Drechslerella stenobrocha 248]
MSTPSPKDDLLQEPKYEVQPRPSRWGITWRSPTLAVGAFIAGLATAIGNHFFFTRLHNAPYENVVWVGRYALVLALVVKTCFAVTVLVCYEQIVWMGLRHQKKGISIRAIDALFGATYQVISLFYPSLWLQHPIAAVMIALRWLLPLISIVSPTTLTVQVRETVDFAGCQVPSLNFSADSIPSQLGVDPTAAVMTDLVQSEYTGNRWFTTPLASKIGTLTALLGQPVNFESPCGLNCSYTVEYYAPVWQCADVDPRDQAAPWELANITNAPWASSNIGRRPYTSTYKYVAEVSSETGKLWVGHLIWRNVTEDSNTTFWDRYGLETFTCHNYNASISVRQGFLNGEQRASVVERINYGERVDPYLTDAWVEDRRIPRVVLQRHQLSYEMLAELFVGSISYESRAGRDFITNTSILNMPAFLRDSPSGASGGQNGELKDQLRPLVEQLSLNFSMSIMGFPQLVVQQLQDGNCTMTTSSNVWRYESRNLTIAYAVGAVVAFLALGLGALGVMKNGVVTELSFSQVVATTRNPELDELMRGNCVGNNQLKPSSLYDVKLRLGELGEEHAAFGTPESVTTIRRGARYI